VKSSGVVHEFAEGVAPGVKVLSEGQLNNTNYAGRPSMCRNCGALVGANETNCSLCGAPKTSTAAAATGQAQAPEQVHDHETIRFARAILSRPYIFTIVFLVANIFVFFLTSQAGANENAAALVKYGAKVNSLIDTQQEWWRFVTPIFLHGNIAHLLMNMYGLWVIGPYVERLYGSAKFVFFWVATGVAGVVASYLSVQPGMHNSGPLGRFLFKAGDTISVGASGALFGLIGVLFIFGIKFRRELPEGFKRAFGVGMLPTILLNIFIGYAIPVIDNAAHMGGLVAGALLALVVGYKRPGESAGVAVFWHILQVLALALVVVSFVMVARNFNKTYPNLADVTPPSLFGSDANVKGYLDALNNGQSVFINALEKEDSGSIDEAIKQLASVKPPDTTATSLRDELRMLLVRVREFLATPSAKRTKQRTRAQKNELFLALNEWMKKRNQWVKTEGSNYGVFLEEPPNANKPAK
jgi:rhomboid protease GluP